MNLKEKTGSIPWSAAGQTIILGLWEKQRVGCRGRCFQCRQGWTLGVNTAPDVPSLSKGTGRGQSAPYAKVGDIAPGGSRVST